MAAKSKISHRKANQLQNYVSRKTMVFNNHQDGKWKKLENEWFNSKYQLIEFKGAGGFGAVFTVNEIIADRLIRDSREIVIKLIPIDPDNLDRQIQELQLAVRLKHPCLINSDTVESGQIDGEGFLGLVMELADMSLQDYILSQFSQTLPEDEVIAIAKSVASGLNYLHQQLDREGQKIVHQDLKPANILRVKNSWKITDFGIARILETGKTQILSKSQVMGTPEYAPPEAYDNKVATAWDIWSLGILLSGLLSGKHPFHSTSPAQLMKKVWMEEPEIHDSISSSLSRVIKGCLTKEYKQRWTAQQVLDGLSQTSTFRNYVESLPGRVELEMIAIPGGSFIMGSPDGEGFDDERPQHRVTVQPFFIGKFPITQAQWQAVMGDNPAFFQDNSLNPVECITWEDAKKFCSRLSQKTGKEYRLPTEAEWEYACRAGTSTPFHFGETITTDLANYDGNYTYANAPKGEYRQKTTSVEQFPPNAFGLYDMHGNVWEWCQDDWHDSYKNAPNDGSAWVLEVSSNKVIRGGSWNIDPEYCRSATRNTTSRDNRSNVIGFRVVCVVPRAT